MLYALPTLTEEKISCYIKANYQGSYNINKAFGVEPYELPLILVKAGKFKQVEPGTDLYNGDLAIAIQTQIDDVADPVAIHDGTVAAIYQLMQNQSAVQNAINGGSAFQLWSIWPNTYDQDRADRGLFSILTYDINVQTLAV
jgi:hypothetical protein